MIRKCLQRPKHPVNSGNSNSNPYYCEEVVYSLNKREKMIAN